MAKKRKVTEFPSIPDLPEGAPVAPFSSNNPFDSKNLQRGSVTNPKLFPTARAATAIVGTSKGTGIDFIDIQDAINQVDRLGGGTVLVTAGTYYPKKEIELKSNIHLIGQDPETAIIDFTSVSFPSSAHAVDSSGIRVTNTGTVEASSDSNTITGDGTTFLTHGVQPGDQIYLAFHPYVVATISSDTSLTLTEEWEGANTDPSNFAIIRPKSNIFIENLTVANVKATTANRAINYAYCTDISVKNVKALNCNGSGIAISSSFNFIISESESRNCLNGIFINQEGSGVELVTNGSVINCVSWNNTSRGIGIDINTAVRVLGSSFGSNNVGVKLLGERSHISNCLIEGNRVDGVNIQDGARNVIANNYIASNAGDGIDLNGDSDDNRIVGNTVDSNGDNGIELDTDTDRNIMAANTITDNGDWGIDIVGGTGNRTAGNIFSGNTTGKVNDGGTNTIRATRYVPLTNAVSLINTGGPATTYTDVDVTASTSATAMAAVLVGQYTSATVTRALRVRPNGSTDDGFANNITSIQVANQANQGRYKVGLDSGQIFEYRAQGGTDATVISIVGYDEFTD